jgi:hypothetical protein
LLDDLNDELFKLFIKIEKIQKLLWVEDNSEA